MIGLGENFYFTDLHGRLISAINGRAGAIAARGLDSGSTTGRAHATVGTGDFHVLLKQ